MDVIWYSITKMVCGDTCATVLYNIRYLQLWRKYNYPTIVMAVCHFYCEYILELCSVYRW